MRQILLLLLSPLLCLSQGYYLTGAIRELEDGITIRALVNSLTSVDAIIPFKYYDLQYCKLPESEQQEVEDNLGMMLRGDHIEDSPYEFVVLQNETCKVVNCGNGEGTLKLDALKKFDEFIKKGYRANMVLDNLPVIATEKARAEASKRFCGNRKAERVTPEVRGVAIGGCVSNRVYINNHLNFEVQYHTTENGIVIVGFEVTPESYSDGCKGSKLFTNVKAKPDELTVPWTYAVHWVEKPDQKWVTRWDYYLRTSEADSNATQHWVEITKSMFILLCLSGVVVVIIMRTLHLDFNRYNNPDNDEELQEEVGWKLVHSEVFRPPKRPILFSGVVGTGTQLIGLSMMLLTAAMLGFVSPAFRGAMLSTSIFIFVLMSFVNGFVSATLQNMFQVKSWKAIFLSSILYPGFVFSLWATCECMLAWRGAATAVPFTTVLTIIGIWFGLSIPQVILGASFAFRCTPISNPLRYNELHRDIPPQRWMFSPFATVLLPGIIPFGAAALELRLITRAIWQGQVYYVFGFLALVFVVVLVTVALTVITYIYYQLVFEDYRWWWKSLFVPSGLGFYYLLNSLQFYYSVLNVRSWTGSTVFFSFNIAAAISLNLMVGTIGFFASFIFIRTIYGSIKVE
eukprot:TRINITY_DN903_c3_g1_i1.p1 TRINITY_DN903_c3_g1~~TRINITY_DN903_c3_g1_i1.p1  ORF type:complete len:627 (+),score=97.42 TRINITY_DN903_c3_g1_i1:54-1934(+)